MWSLGRGFEMYAPSSLPHSKLTLSTHVTDPSAGSKKSKYFSADKIKPLALQNNLGTF